MPTLLLAPSSTVIDLAEIPWATVAIALGVAWTLLEARLMKAGYVKEPSLDGLGKSLRERQDVAAKEVESLSRQFLMARADLDETRDRVTRTEAAHEAMSARMTEQVTTPLARIEGMMSQYLQTAAHQAADIDMLKKREEMRSQRENGVR